MELFEKVRGLPVPANSASSCFFRISIVFGSCVRTLHWKLRCLRATVCRFTRVSEYVCREGADDEIACGGG